MIYRTLDVHKVAEAVWPYPELLYDFDVIEWLNEPRNYALVKDNDVAMFSYVRPGVYQGHYFFQSRGKKALKRAREFLSEFFSYDSVDTVEGLTPLFCKGALSLTKKLGFESFGEIETPQGKCELFIMTRDVFEKVSKEWAS